MLSDYCASKFATLGLSEALSMEMGSDNRNIIVTSATPYFFDSGMFEGVSHSSFLPLQKVDRVADRIIYGIVQEE